MKKTELLTQILENHNRIARIEVHGEGAILVAETLLDLRRLLSRLQAEAIEEETSN
jgi:hypothetical protein